MNEVKIKSEQVHSVRSYQATSHVIHVMFILSSVWIDGFVFYF